MKLFKKSDVLLIPFVVLTGSIVILCLLTQVLINLSLKDIKSDSQTVKAATNQRVLSQQIVNELAADNLAGILVGQPIDKLSKFFLSTHISILKGDSENLKPLEGNFFPEYKKMDDAFKEFFASVAFVANSDNDNKAFVDLLNKQEDYIKTIDALIIKIDKYSKIEIDRFQEKEILIMIISLLIVFLEVIFIFLPSIRKIKKQSLQFRAIAFNQSHIIRQPLANIIGLLNIIDTNALDENNREIIEHVNDQAEKLDTVIKDTIYRTAEG